MTDAGTSGGASLLRALVELDDEYAAVLALLDRDAATHRFASQIPDVIGVDMGWVGQSDIDGRMVLHHVVGGVTENVDGLVVPVGTGLGGRVSQTRTPLWVRDYRTAEGIQHDLAALQQAEAEGVQSMIGVPILGTNGAILGVLYGATRYEAEFGDRATDALLDLAARTAAACLVAERSRHAATVAVHEERRRLAFELHDTVGATLFTLRAGIEQIAEESHLDQGTRDRLAAIDRGAREAAAAVRGFMKVLNDPPEQVAVGVALRGHCRALTERSDVDARVLILTDLPALPYSRVRILTDAVRECLLNVEKHAQAHSVVVTVFAQRGGVAVTVSDDGVGLAEDFDERGGLGMVAMTERLTQAGGTIAVGAGDDGGLTVQLWMPV
jgi:signal transduction histidine kinase